MNFKLTSKLSIKLFFSIAFILTVNNFLFPCVYPSSDTVPAVSDLSAKADINSLNKELTEATKKNNVNKVVYCLKNGADPNTLQGPYQNAPLHHAARNNNLGITKVLLQYGANVRIKDSLGLTPIHYAWFYKSGEVQRFLCHVLCSTPTAHDTTAK